MAGKKGWDGDWENARRGLFGEMRESRRAALSLGTTRRPESVHWIDISIKIRDRRLYWLNAGKFKISLLSFFLSFDGGNLMD